MAGPWERYQKPAAAAGPWDRYRQAAPVAAAPAAEFVAPPPPPGAIIHGTDRSYAADDPSTYVDRSTSDISTPEAGRRSAIEMQALQARDQTKGLAADVARPVVPFTQGTTMNFGDELISAIFGGSKALTGGDFRDSYDYAQEFQRQEKQKQVDAHPIISALSEIAGGIGTGISAARGGLTLTGRMASEGLANLLPRTVAGAVEGAGWAGLAGFGGADGGVENPARQAAANLPVGAVVGGLAPGLGDLLSGGARMLRNAYVGMRNPELRGDELVVRGMMRDQTNPNEAAAALDDAAKAGQPDYRYVDAAGKNTQRLGAMASKTPGEFRNTSAETLAARQQGQGTRIGDYVDQALGASGPDAYATEQGIAASRKAAAQPLYQEAYKAPAPAGQFYDDMLNRQSVKEALGDVRATAAERQAPITDMFTEMPNPEGGDPIQVPTVRGWDQIKRALDAKVNQLYKAGDTTRAEAVKETRNALREQLAADVPKYGEALKRYSDDTSALEAIGVGRDVVNARNSDAARAAYRAVPDGQKDLSRIGAAREIGVKLENSRAGQDKTLTFDTPAMAKKLDELISDPETRALLTERLNRERDMVRAGRALTGGSNTFENLADGTDVGNTGGALAALFSGHPLRAAGLLGGQALGAVTRAASGMNEETAKRVGEYLMSADPAQIRGLADLFAEMQNAATRPSMAPSAASAGVAAPRTGERRR